VNGHDWERLGGIFCSSCHQEVLRLIDGLCIFCYRKKIAKREADLEDASMRRYYQRALSRGEISLAQMRDNQL